MNRHKHSGPGNASGLHSDAYAFQQGEFYPQHHQANVQRLHQKYPEFPLSEIDTVYRQACRIDFEVQERVGGAQLSQQAREDFWTGLGTTSMVSVGSRFCALSSGQSRDETGF